MWSGHRAETVFEACWLIETQLREMREAGYTMESARKELADVLAITLREMDGFGWDPAETLEWRLGTRHAGQVDIIWEKYRGMFRKEFDGAIKAIKLVREKLRV